MKQLDQFLCDKKEVKNFISKHNLIVQKPGDIPRNVKKYINKLNASGPTLQFNWIPYYVRQADIDTGSYLLREYYRQGDHDHAGNRHRNNYKSVSRRKPDISKASLYELTKLLVDNNPSIKEDLSRIFRSFGGRDAEEEWLKFLDNETDFLRPSPQKSNQKFYICHLKFNSQTEMVDTEEAFALAINIISVRNNVCFFVLLI